MASCQVTRERPRQIPQLLGYSDAKIDQQGMKFEVGKMSRCDRRAVGPEPNDHGSNESDSSRGSFLENEKERRHR